MIHRSTLGPFLAALSLASATCTHALHAQSAPVNLRSFLAGAAGMTTSQLDAVTRGETVVRMLPTGDSRDVAVMGVVRVDRPRDALIAEMRDRGAAHPFSSPAVVEDVAGMHLTRDDLKDLARCQPNDCNFKLPAAAMASFRSIIAPNPSSPQGAEDYLRRWMTEFVDAYRERGNAAMIAYDDMGSVQSSSAFEAMVRDSSLVYRVAPTLARFLLEYPRASLPEARDAIYWTVDTLPHVRPTMRILQQITYAPSELASTTVIVKKQLFADHYFEAALEVLTATDDSLSGFEGGKYQTDVVMIRRYRFDHLPSGGLFNLRGRVLGGLRDAVTDELKKLR